jgi:hypothetical protein
MEIWSRLAGDWKPRHLEAIAAPSMTLEDLPQAFDQLLSGGGRGRITVDLTQGSSA